jgi:hypothetical protein
MRYGKIRTAVYKHIDNIELINMKYDTLILYTLKFITDYYKTKTSDEFAMFWRCATAKMHINEEQINEVEECFNINDKYKTMLSELDNEDLKKEIYEMAETIVATVKPRKAKDYIICLQEISQSIGFDYDNRQFEKKLDFFQNIERKSDHKKKHKLERRS